jgi:hypothetical protein
MTTDVEFLQIQISVFVLIEGRWFLILNLRQKLPFELMKIKHSKNKTLFNAGKTEEGRNPNKII